MHKPKIRKNATKIFPKKPAKPTLARANHSILDPVTTIYMFLQPSTNFSLILSREYQLSGSGLNCLGYTYWYQWPTITD